MHMGDKKSAYETRAETLFHNARSKDYPKHQLIHYQDDPLSHIYLIRKGHIKVYTILDSGDTRTMMILSPGDIFPIAFSVTLDWENYQIKYFYQTLVDTTVDILPIQDFRDLLESNQAAARTYMAYLAASNQAILNQLEVMKNKKAINKVELLLPYLVLKLGDEVAPNTYKLRIRLSHQEVADLSGVTRETTTTLVKQLEKAGIIEQIRGQWIIHIDRSEAGPFQEN